MEDCKEGVDDVMNDADDGNMMTLDAADDADDDNIK